VAEAELRDTGEFLNTQPQADIRLDVVDYPVG